MRPDREQLFECDFESPLDAVELAHAAIATFESTINRALQELGLRPLGSIDDAGWFELDREHARRHLLHGFRHDLAYGTVRRDAATATALATVLLARWPFPVRFLAGSDLHTHLDVHGTLPSEFSYVSGRPIRGTHEFEESLIILMPNRMAVHVVSDDD